MTQAPTPVPSRRITLVADELLGYVQNAGLGTATTCLALALARIGHEVEVLYLGPPQTGSADSEWPQRYERAGVRIRTLSPSGERVEPSYFARLRDIELALREEPPDVVIAQDLGAPAYAALRLRQLGLGFENTLFVVFCHGTRLWITDVSRKLRVLPGALAVTVLEQASLELADAVVSPSAYLVDWMRGHGWSLPAATVVIPYVTRAGATGEPLPRVPADDRPVRRIAFFGRLEERKGVRPLVAGLNALEPALLDGLDLLFLGRPKLPADQIEASISEEARQALRSVSFESSLGQEEALARLGEPGTLAVMPSLEDNSPNTVYECLERGIRFVASSTGGIGELVAPDDRARVLFEPTPEGVEAALRGALAGREPFRPARPAFDAATSLERWAEVVATPPPLRGSTTERPAVDVVVVDRSSRGALSPCLAALERQSYPTFSVIASEGASTESARRAGLRQGEAPWVVFLDGEDVPEDELLETLVAAQAASGADVVTCGLYLEDVAGGRTQHFFLGEPGGLGLLANSYGTVALLRRSLLTDEETVRAAEGDADWPLLARLSSTGARIVSIPLPLVTRRALPGRLDAHPSDALLVVQELERALPEPLRSVARLAAGLAADSQAPAVAPSDGIVQRAGDVLRNEGLAGLARRAGRGSLRRLSRGSR
jgi:glycosyltransferase involved in cell wall biosynthesis